MIRIINKKFPIFLNKIFKGFIIGVAAIIPGLSGGVIAAAYGIYEPALDAALNIFNDTLKSIKFLLPYVFGGVLGVFLFSGIIRQLIQTSYDSVIYCFTGLVTGSMPALIKKANERGFKLRYIAVASAAFLAVIFLNHTELFEISLSETSFSHIIIGAVISFGTVIPGVSSSFILIKIGLYKMWLSAISGIDILSFLKIGAGFSVTTVLLMKISSFLFKKFYGYTYYFIIGFLGASVILIFPGFPQEGRILANGILFFSGIILGIISL